jgi:glycosyltransferase involved in cell wall biosynthesis
MPVKPIPVLLAVRELNCGGIERDVAKIALNLDRARFVPHVAAYSARGLRYEELHAAGIPVLELPVRSLASWSAVRAALKAAQYIRRHGIRLVHAWDPTAVFLVPLARLLRVPAVLASQLGHRGLSDPRTRKELRVVDRMVDAVVVNCEAMRRHMVEEEGLPAGRIRLCYNGVDLTQFFPGPKPDLEFLRGASLTIGTVAVLRPEKALEVLIEAFAKLRSLQSGLRLIIVGDGPELGRLQARSRRLGLEGDCLFLPPTRDVPPLLRALDIFVLCSRSEAFSNALLEAMACGCCVVGTEVGGTPELIGRNERGLLCRPEDPDDLAAQLAALIQDEPLRRRLGAEAARYARQNLSIEAAARRMAEIYAEFLDSSVSARR